MKKAKKETCLFVVKNDVVKERVIEFYESFGNFATLNFKVKDTDGKFKRKGFFAECHVKDVREKFILLSDISDYTPVVFENEEMRIKYCR